MHIVQFPDKEPLLTRQEEDDSYHSSHLLQLEQALQESKQEASALREELEALVAQMQKIRTYVLEAQQENQLLRQTLETIQTEAQEKEGQVEQFSLALQSQEEAFRKAQEDLAGVKEENIQLQDQQTQLRHAFTESQNLLKLSETAHEKLQSEYAELKEALDTTKQQLSLAKEEQAILQNEALTRIQDHQNLTDALSAFTEGYHEKEEELHVAQQHLAKKVKEGAQFAQIQEALEEQLAALQAELEKEQNSVKAKTALITTLQENEARLTSRLNQEMEAAKAHITTWKRDYTQVKEQAEEAQDELKRYRQLQERLTTLQRFFCDLSPLLQNSENSPFANLKKEAAVANASYLHAEEEAWEFTKGAWRARQNFFEP